MFVTLFRYLKSKLGLAFKQHKTNLYSKALNEVLCVLSQLNPILGLPGVILLVFLTPNPPRGASETNGEERIERTSYLEDVKYLLRKWVPLKKKTNQTIMG